MSGLPEYLELAHFLSLKANYDSAIPSLSTATLSLILPYCHLSTLLNLSLHPTHSPQLFGTTPKEIARRLTELIDWQRDWCLTKECPERLRDLYLVNLADEGMSEAASEQLSVVPEGMNYLLRVDRRGGPSACPTVQTFQTRLEVMSNGMLRNIDWSNVVLGGGAVLACLSDATTSYEFGVSDFDLFLHGLEPHELIPKVNSIIKQISTTLPPYDPPAPKPGRRPDAPTSLDQELLIIKGLNAVTLLPPLNKSYRRRTVQIVLQTNTTKFDAVAGFDLDICSMMYDGEKILGTPASLRAWTSKINYFDPRRARNFDTTASLVSSRAVKYQSRGYSLGLAPAALAHLGSSSPLFDLTATLNQIRRTLSYSTKRDLFGVESLLSKELSEQPRQAIEKDSGPELDYGPSKSALVHHVSPLRLRAFGNGKMVKSYQNHEVEIASFVRAYFEDDERLAEWNRSNDFGLATSSIPYIVGIDPDLLFGMKEEEFSSPTNLQYVVAVPKTLLPFVEKAEREIEEAMNNLAISHHASQFSQQDARLLHRALATVKTLHASHPASPTSSSSLIPPFLSPFDPFKTHDTSSLSPIRLLHPVVNNLQQAIGPTPNACAHVYRTFVISSLLQFRGFSPLVDQAKDLLFRCYNALAYVAVSSPQYIDITLTGARSLNFTFKDKEFSRQIITRLAESKTDYSDLQTRALNWHSKQPTKEQVEKRFTEELDCIAEVAKVWMEKAGEKTELAKVGEWDDDRKRWLDEYMAGKPMV